MAMPSSKTTTSDPAGFTPHAVVGNDVFHVLIGTKDTRSLRTALLDLARVVAGSAAVRRAFLALEEPGITDSRLHEEWLGAASILRPEVMDRAQLVIHRRGTWTGIPRAPSTHEATMLDDVLHQHIARRPAPVGRVFGARDEIFRILFHQWLLRRGPVSVGSLMEMTGASHPTVAGAVRSLEHLLVRHSNRSVEFRSFPQDEWARWVAMSEVARGTVRFVDRSGRARSPESLLRRLGALGREDIAVGGVLGARHYYPSLDLVGTARLDVSVHSGRHAADLSFVERLDPALERTTRPDESPALVIHGIRRAQSLFQPSDGCVPWADPVECLLDLHEARLEPQAMEFLQAFSDAKEIR